MKARILSLLVFILLLGSSRSASAQCSCENGSVLCKCEMIEGTIESRCCAKGTVCIDQECQPAPPFCVTSADCGEGRTCTEEGRCTCATNDDCGQAGLVCGEDKVCYALCDDDHACDSDFVCENSRCTLKPCAEDSECDLSRCVREEGHCAPHFVCATNFHCRNVDTQFGGAPRICGPEGKCIEPSAASEAAGCACSSVAGVGEIFVPAAIGMISAAALARLRAKTRRRSAARRSA